MQTLTRVLSTYEKNHLLRFGFDPEKVLLHLDEKPVEYFTGHVQFLNQDFLVTPDVLIPRVETEELVSMILADTTHQPTVSKTWNILDVGTGSGVIGLSLTQAWLNQGFSVKLVGVDSSSSALTVAKKNLEHLGIPHPATQWYTSDLLDAVPTQKFDLVVANLPYIPHQRVATLDSSVRDYEPRQALDGGDDGTEIILRLLNQLPPFLENHHRVWLEVDHTHTLPLLLGDNPEWHGTLIKDSNNQTRFVHLELQT